MKIFGNEYAVQRLCLYNLFNSLAIAPACNLAFTDKLMLQMDLALENFGLIKGIMFLIPPLLYALAVPLLTRIHADIKICVYSYIIRASFPMTLPLLALCTDNKQILTAACIIVLSTAMTCAVFANNSLMTIFRLALQKADYNLNIGLIMLHTQLPASLMSLPLAWYLDLFEGAPPQHFYWAFMQMHVVCVLFEIPAAWNMFKLHLNYPQKKQARKIHLGFLIPYKDMKYLPILILTILNGIISGVAGSYLVLYLLEDLKFSMTLVTIIGFAMGILINITLPLCGKITDKMGYRFLFLLLASGMLIGFALFSIFWGALWILPLFAVLAWSGSGSLCGGWLTWGLQAAGSRLQRPRFSETYISAFSISYNGGLFLGSTLAGLLIAMIKSCYGTDISVIYQKYFLCILPFAFMLFAAAFIYRFMMSKNPVKIKG